MAQERLHPFEHDDLAALRTHGHVQTDHRREPRVGESRCNDYAIACVALARCVNRETACKRLDAIHRMMRPVHHALLCERRVQRTQQTQRIRVAVVLRVARADHFRPDARIHRLQFRAIEQSPRILRKTRLRVQLFEERLAARPFVIGEQDMQATRLSELRIDARRFDQLACELRPQRRGTQRPRGVPGHAESLALHPHEPEVRTRRAKREIALVEHGDFLVLPREPVSDRRADEPAADHGKARVGRLLRAHRASCAARVNAYACCAAAADTLPSRRSRSIAARGRSSGAP